MKWYRGGCYTQIGEVSTFYFYFYFYFLGEVGRELYPHIGYVIGSNYSHYLVKWYGGGCYTQLGEVCNILIFGGLCPHNGYVISSNELKNEPWLASAETYC